MDHVRIGDYFVKNNMKSNINAYINVNIRDNILSEFDPFNQMNARSFSVKKRSKYKTCIVFELYKSIQNNPSFFLFFLFQDAAQTLFRYACVFHHRWSWCIGSKLGIERNCN